MGHGFAKGFCIFTDLKNVIMTEAKTIYVLDAGGTGFKFTAVREGKEIIAPFTIPAAGASLDEVLQK